MTSLVTRPCGSDLFTETVTSLTAQRGVRVDAKGGCHYEEAGDINSADTGYEHISFYCDECDKQMDEEACEG